MDIPLSRVYGDMKTKDHQNPKLVFNEMQKYIIKQEKLWVNSQKKIWKLEYEALKNQNKKLLTFTQRN